MPFKIPMWFQICWLLSREFGKLCQLQGTIISMVFTFVVEKI